MNNGISNWPMGRGFGGSQLINNMIYDRGHQYDYLNWFDTSTHRYNYTKDILPYFMYVHFRYSVPTMSEIQTKQTKKK